MEKYVIEGGRKLSGKITIESAKNAVLPMIAGAMLTEEDVTIKNCPKISDVYGMLDIIKYLGGKFYFDGSDLTVNCKEIIPLKISKKLTSGLRTSVLSVGALTGRFLQSTVSFPGGCNIGSRPFDIHIDALNKLGANIRIEGDRIISKAKSLKGSSVVLKYPSVGATENALLCSVLARGKTVIYNSAREPEIEDFVNFLNSMGAKIVGDGTSTITVYGEKKLHGTVFCPVFDRIEAGTYMVSALITGGEIELKNVKSENISSLIGKLCENTCKIKINNDIIYIKSGRVKKPFDITTGPHPAFPTDMQAQICSLLSVSKGSSTITETVFENRFQYVKELQKMGADISVFNNVAKITGVKRLHGEKVYAGDLRGGAALVLAGLSAEGNSEIYGINHIERGYSDMCGKLRRLNANVEKREE